MHFLPGVLAGAHVSRVEQLPCELVKCGDNQSASGPPRSENLARGKRGRGENQSACDRSDLSRPSKRHHWITELFMPCGGSQTSNDRGGGEQNPVMAIQGARQRGINLS